MDHEEIRKGIGQAKLNANNSEILYGELTLIAVVLGLGTKSWWVFGGVFLGLIIVLNIPPLAFVLMLLLSLAWGAIGYGIGTLFQSIPASIVLGILGFLIGLGIHISGYAHSQDT